MRTVVSVVLALFVTSQVFAESRIRRSADPVQDQYIVVLRDTTRTDAVQRAHALAYAHRGRVLAVLKHGIVGFGIELSESDAEALALSPYVQSVEEDSRAFLSASIVQPFPDGELWHLDRIDNRGPLSATRSYEYTSTGDPVNVYVIGTGVLASHVEF